MDERLLSLVFLLMAAVLPLRGLGAQWAGRPDRRLALRLLWIAYTLVAMGAVAALLLQRSGGELSPPPDTGDAQLVLRAGAAA